MHNSRFAFIFFDVIKSTKRKKCGKDERRKYCIEVISFFFFFFSFSVFAL